MIQFDCWDASYRPYRNNLWYRTPLPDGSGRYYVWSYDSAQCLSVEDSLRSNGANIIQWDCIANFAMQWYFSNSSMIWNANSQRCLSVSGASTDSGANVIQWDCIGHPAMEWRLVPV